MAKGFEIRGIEDAYDGYAFDTFDDLMESFDDMCRHHLYGRWNVPIWIDSPEENEFEYGDTIILGLLLTRHGRAVQWHAPHPGEEGLNKLRTAVLEVWAGRADTGFARHPALEPTEA